ncbi:MAG: alpha/beta fold hydrolase, partial [Candidatus Paceibacterota bacterium]
LHDGVKAYRYRSLPIPKSGGWYLAFPTVGELKKVFIEEKVDIVHILLPMSGAIVAIKAARALGIKIVAHSHSQPENLFMDMPKIIQPTLHNLWNKYLTWIYSKAESVIYPSEMARSLLHNLSPGGQPSTVISNGINLDEFKKKDIGDFCTRFNIPEKSLKLLFVGRLFPEKSVHTLIEAMPEIIKIQKDTHLMLAGSGFLRPKLEKLALKLGVASHVTFLGFVSEDDKILAYNACDIFLLPSLAELEGMAVLEAMACGKPIIISDTEMSASRYFVDGNGFLFKTSDHLSLSREILKLATNPELRKSMGEASLKKIKDYDINKSVSLLEEVYYSALGNNKKVQEYILNNEISYRKNKFNSERLTLVFIHGVSGSSSAWLPYEKIFENKYNLLVYDMRGHGLSKKFLNYSDYEVRNFAKDLEQLVSHLQISKFILISNSFACLIALEYLKSHRDTVVGNIFTSPEIYLAESPQAKIMRPALSIFASILKLLPFNPTPRGRVDYQKYIGSTDWDIDRNWADIRNTLMHSHFYTLRQSLNLGMEYALDKINVPTLIIHGEKDTMVSPQNALKMSESVKNSEIVIIPNVDHNTAHNAVSQMSSAIEAFIQKNKAKF